MDACALIEHMYGLGVRLITRREGEAPAEPNPEGGSTESRHPTGKPIPLLYHPTSAIAEETRQALREMKADIIAHLMCPVCGAIGWMWSIPGGGVFCGGCSDPSDIGLSESEVRPAKAEELRRVWAESEFWIGHRKEICHPES